jgi:hypothetical protein
VIRESTQVVYEAGGMWKGTIQHAQTTYDVISEPRASVTTEEGAPQIPQEGILVAVPKGAKNLAAKLISKEMQAAPGKWKLKPAPKPIIEAQYIAGKEEIRPNSKIYSSDNEYPGKDFDFLGLRTVDGIPVAHLILYLAQYKPLSGTLSLVKSMTIEISYDVPPQADAVPKKRVASPMASIILDEENIKVSEATAKAAVGAIATPFHVSLAKATGLTPSTIFTTQPVASALKPGAVVAPVHLAKLKLTTVISEYVIVAPNAMKTSVDPLLKAKSGWPHYAMFAATEDITKEFPAASLKESIKAFLAWAWDNWTVPPRFVVLAGDTDTIPVDLVTIGGTTYASDHYYADIHGSYAPEIVVSRLPTSDAAKMLQICQQLANYANLRGPDWGGWENEVLLVAYQLSVYMDCSNDIANDIAPRFKVTKKYGDTTTKQQVMDELNAGVIIANYRGHGSKTAWLSANGISTADIKTLNNGSMPPMVFNVCCENGWIDDNTLEVVVETFLREGKAVVVLGASRDSPTYANNDFDNYLFQAIMDGATTPGDIFKRAKTLMVVNYPASTEHKEDVAMYNLFGDPTARVVSDVEFLRGKWNMDHDGWQGVLEINRIWNHRIEINGNCGYPVWSISGTYSASGKTYTMTGNIGGRDTNDLNAGCKRSDHKVEFTISFEPANPQKFTGYVMTWARNVVAGYTWWSNRPFGWYAKKQ